MNEFQYLTVAAIYLSGNQNFEMREYEESDVRHLYKAALTIKKLENEYLEEFNKITQSIPV